MSTQHIAFLVMAVVLLGISILGLIRNQWVYRNRMHLLAQCKTHEDIAEFLSWPGYNDMMNKFWVWDFEKFRPKKE